MKRVTNICKCDNCGEFEWCACFHEDEFAYFGKWDELFKNIVSNEKIDEHRYRVIVHCPKCGKKYTIEGQF